MSKLAHIRTALSENPNIKIVGVLEENFFPERHGVWSHIVEFYVAPRGGGLYEAKTLQGLLLALVPGLEPEVQESFSEAERASEICLIFGKLFYQEEIGVECVTRQIRLFDEELFSSTGFASGEGRIERVEVFLRKIWVKLFPTIEVARGALYGENQYFIPTIKLAMPRVLGIGC